MKDQTLPYCNYQGSEYRIGYGTGFSIGTVRTGTGQIPGTVSDL